MDGSIISKMLQKFYRSIYKNLKKLSKTNVFTFEFIFMEVIEIQQNEYKREQSQQSAQGKQKQHKQSTNYENFQEERKSQGDNQKNVMKGKTQQKLRSKDHEQIDLNNAQQEVEIHFKVAVVSQKIQHTPSMIKFKKDQRKQLRKWMTNHPGQLPFDKLFCKKAQRQLGMESLDKQPPKIRKRRTTRQKRPTIQIKRSRKQQDNYSPIQKISRDESQSQQSQQQSPSQKDLTLKNENSQFVHKGQQKLDFDEFLDRRLSNQSGKIDLGVANLSQVVEHAHSHQLLTNQIYFEFVSKYEEKVLYEFIHWFQKNTNQGWNFNKYKINILDHRRISTLLVSLYPDQFVLYEPLSLNQKVSEFLEFIYKMNQIEYFNLMDQFDNVHKIKWWKPLHVKYFRIIRSLNPKNIENSQVIRTQNILPKYQKPNIFPKKTLNQQSQQNTDKEARSKINLKSMPSKRSLKELLGYDQLQTKSQYKGEASQNEQNVRIKKLKK